MRPLDPVFLAQPVAHRGLHGAARPENTRAAISAAVDARYGVEIDVQPSSDGVAMIFHDDTLDRLTPGTGPITAKPASALKDLPVADTSERIPTLQDGLALIGGRAPLFIELKDQDGAFGPGGGDIVGPVLDALGSYRGPVAVMSFNPHIVARLKARAPHLTRGLVTRPFTDARWSHVPDARRASLRAMEGLVALEVDYVAHRFEDLGSPVVAERKAEGYPILTWTVRSEDNATKARQIADAIIFEGFRPRQEAG